MAEPDERAQLEYQRSLAALHEARAALDEVAAARRRLVIDRSGLSSPQVHTLDAELRSQHQILQARIEQLRVEAQRLRSSLQGGAHPEPDEIEPAAPVEGFEQPPFGTEPR